VGWSLNTKFKPNHTARDSRLARCSCR